MDGSRPPKLEGCPDDTSAYRLLNLMENISEDHYAAGWMSGLEYDLFDVIYAGEQYGFGLTHDEISRLLTYHYNCQGWWIWSMESRGRRFVTLDEWLPMYAEHHRPR